MRKRSLFHLCLLAGAVLLIGQLVLLAVLLYSDSSPSNSAVHDVQLFLNATASLHVPVILLDTILLEKFVNTRQVYSQDDYACFFCDISHPIAFGALFKHIAQVCIRSLRKQYHNFFFCHVHESAFIQTWPQAGILFYCKNYLTWIY